MLPNSNQSPNAAEKLISKYGDYSQKKRDGMNVVIKQLYAFWRNFRREKTVCLAFAGAPLYTLSSPT